MPKAKQVRARHWCFTLNNPVSPNPIQELPMEATYLIYQLEQGEQQTPHLQGYIEFKKQVLFSRIKALLPQGCHIEIARGNPDQNRTYCTKTPRLAGPFEFGTISQGMGHRSDLEDISNMVMKTGSLVNVPPKMIVKYGKGLQMLSSMVQPPYRKALKVITIIGYTGLGKTFAIKNSYPNNSYSPYYGNNGIWFDGYYEQAVLLLDEFYGQVPLHKILQLLDPYPLRVETKGGTAPLHATLIFLTSNATPDKWYPNDQSKKDRTQEIEALYRRIGYPNGINYIDLSERKSLFEDRANLNNRLYFALADALPPPTKDGLEKLHEKFLIGSLNDNDLPDEIAPQEPTITTDPGTQVNVNLVTPAQFQSFMIPTDDEDDSIFNWTSNDECIDEPSTFEEKNKN